MIITISGSPGSGKSTVAKLVAEKLGLKHHSVGDFMREIAEKRGVSMLELSRIAEKGHGIDDELNDMIKSLEEEDNFIIDSRLAFHFFPKAKRIFLDVSWDAGAKRIFEDIRPEEKENTSLESTKENNKKRVESENKRYMDYYGINIRDKSKYDSWIDTTDMTIEEVVDAVISSVR